MNIAIDAGGLCVDQGYGNYIFTINFLHAVADFDRTNKYTAYTFCNQTPYQNTTLSYKKIFPKLGFMKVRVSFEEMFHKKTIFLGINQALPFFTQGKIIAFSHGLSFIHYPNFYKNDFSSLKSQLDDYLKKSNIIVTSSDKVKEDLYKYFPKAKNRIFTLLPGLPYDFQSYKPKKRRKYILFVGMNHKIKNVDQIVKLFFEFKKKEAFKDYLLYLVGEFEEFAAKDIRIFRKINRQKLKHIYQEAAVYVAMSHYESFNFPVLEALSQHCPVVALESAVIPEMKKYVYIAKNDEQLISLLKKVVILNEVKNPVNFQRDPSTSLRFAQDDTELRKTFSWEKYIMRLRTLYNEL